MPISRSLASWPEHSPIDSQLGERLLEFMWLESYANLGGLSGPGTIYTGLLKTHPNLVQYLTTGPEVLNALHASANAIFVLLYGAHDLRVLKFSSEFELHLHDCVEGYVRFVVEG